MGMSRLPTEEKKQQTNNIFISMKLGQSYDRSYFMWQWRQQPLGNDVRNPYNALLVAWFILANGTCASIRIPLNLHCCDGKQFWSL